MLANLFVPIQNDDDDPEFDGCEEECEIVEINFRQRKTDTLAGFEPERKQISLPSINAIEQVETIVSLFTPNKTEFRVD